MYTAMTAGTAGWGGMCPLSMPCLPAWLVHVTYGRWHTCFCVLLLFLASFCLVWNCLLPLVWGGCSQFVYSFLKLNLFWENCGFNRNCVRNKTHRSCVLFFQFSQWWHLAEASPRSQSGRWCADEPHRALKQIPVIVSYFRMVIQWTAVGSLWGLLFTQPGDSSRLLLYLCFILVFYCWVAVCFSLSKLILITNFVFLFLCVLLRECPILSAV